MATFSIELAPTSQRSICRCCGLGSQTVHGFVYRDGDAFAVYYAGWLPAHCDHPMTFAIATGAWDEGTTVRDRVSIGLLLPTAGALDPSTIGPDDSPWGETALFGRMLAAENAASHPAYAETLSVFRFVVDNDARIRTFLRECTASRSWRHERAR